MLSWGSEKCLKNYRYQVNCELSLYQYLNTVLVIDALSSVLTITSCCPLPNDQTDLRQQSMPTVELLGPKLCKAHFLYISAIGALC